MPSQLPAGRLCRQASSCGRVRRCWALTAVVAASLPIGAPADAQEPPSYRLETVYHVPDTPPQMLARPVSIKIDVPQREIMVLEAEPPSVVVMTPDGSILRRFGADVLSAPTDLAAIYPPGASYRWNANTGRVMVIEASLGRLHVFDAIGRHLRTIEDDWEPRAIVGVVVEEQPERALVADAKHGRIVALDWEGNPLATGTPGVEAGLRRPILLAGSSFRHLIFESATRRLVWFDQTGTVLKDLKLDDWSGHSHGIGHRRQAARAWAGGTAGRAGRSM